MNNEFKQKSLKLLADPYKLKNHHYIPRDQDKLKSAIEYKFNYDTSNTLYNVIIQDIKILLVIDTVIQGIIDQVNLDQSP